MLSKRIIACLDVRDGKLVKSVQFVNTQEIGDPVSTARQYYEDGIDELVFYDITASSDNRDIMIDVVREVASQVFIPFSVGGGLRSVEDCGRVLLAGAEKVNLNTAAVENPDLITEVSDTFGSQATVLSMDIRINNALPALTSGYEIVTHGGRKPTGIDAIKWAQRGERLGAGELVVNAMDTDGMREGYELILTRIISDSVSIPVIASGGGGHPEHLDEAFTLGGADAAIVASMLHYGDYKISEVKSYLHELGIPMRMTK